MITEWLLTMVVGIFVGLAQLIPWEFEAPVIGEVVGDFLGSFFALNNYVPLLDIMAAVGMILLVRFIMPAWHLIVWIYHQFWGSE